MIKNLSFTSYIIKWYALNKRDLPWRTTSDPYKIWISEIVLQQTRVNQGIQYYYRFIERFPNVITLAEASTDEVLKLWQGLGYYSRARNLHEAAKQITSIYKGIFPKSYKELLELKGIGKYTAGAIASIAYKEKVAVVDGNVYRVLSRFFGIESSIDETGAYQLFSEKMIALMENTDSGLFNQAVMELGALVCLPANPNCEQCPLIQHCIAYNANLQTVLPIRKKSVKIKNRYFNYLVIRYKDRLFFKKRENNDIWKGLYDFPLIESTGQISPEELLQHTAIKNLWGLNSFVLKNVSSELRIKLTHQNLFIRFYEIEMMEMPLFKTNVNEIPISEIDKIAVPASIAVFLEKTF